MKRAAKIRRCRKMQMFNEYNDVVKINDLIKMLGIGRNTAYKLVKTNAIPSIRIGRKHYITKQ